MEGSGKMRSSAFSAASNLKVRSEGSFFVIKKVDTSAGADEDVGLVR